MSAASFKPRSSRPNSGTDMPSKERLQARPIGRAASAVLRAGIWRDKIVKQHPLKKIRTKCLSNTGYVGISETTKWEQSRPYPCFVVSWHENGKPKKKTIIYGRPRSRAKALAMAIKLRKEKTR